MTAVLSIVFMLDVLMLDVAGETARIRASMRSGLEAQARSVAVQRGSSPTVPERSAPSWTCEPLPATSMEPLIAGAAQAYGVRPALVREVARQESGFRPCAVSSSGAQGLMQLMPGTQTQFAVRNPFEPQENIDTGVKLLRQLLDRYHGDVGLALGAYNAGPAAVDRFGGIPPIPETKAYVRSILGRLPPASAK